MTPVPAPELPQQNLTVPSLLAAAKALRLGPGEWGRFGAELVFKPTIGRVSYFYFAELFSLHEPWGEARADELRSSVCQSWAAASGVTLDVDSRRLRSLIRNQHYLVNSLALGLWVS